MKFPIGSIKERASSTELSNFDCTMYTEGKYQVNMKYLKCTNTRSFFSAIIAFSVFFVRAPLVFQVCNIDLINTSTIPGNKQDNIPLGNEQSNQSCFLL